MPEMRNVHMDKKMVRERLFRMVSVGVVDEPLNQCYDVVSTLALLLNLLVTVLMTFDFLSARFGGLFLRLEALTVAFFLIDYCLRLYTAPELYPEGGERKARLRYTSSFAGVIDLLSFLPYYLPVFFPSGAVVFRMFRVVRILRLFRVNAYYDSFNVITEVLSRKRQQLLSSLFIILVLMMSASLCMYSLEHASQPEVFKNAFSGIWWAVSTMLTVGYGDIYPITPLGKAFSIMITFLGVGLVAIPTGIISAGFVDQYASLKRAGRSMEEGLPLLSVRIGRKDGWCGKEIRHLNLPDGLLVVALKRGHQMMAARGKAILVPGDTLFLSCQENQEEKEARLFSVSLGRGHSWAGKNIRDLDMSRQEVILKVKRGEASLLPEEGLTLKEGDELLVYTKLVEQASWREA